ncbi:hypothetical protein COLO4_38441 [Corchorus olitorius]|uniref:Bulb-type lectin domain-containing protein n=1 Tax=Corchorus olitorius TaxID=93759 RepID=A0A1R3FVB8_9ROSI|nr:hypothetical protein COLO4_38441 [Corchorus olitorius]
MAFNLLCSFFFSLFLLILPLSTTAQTYRNISLGSSLTAKNDNSSWTSTSGDFAFGFRQIGEDGFLLAIWFNKIPEKTIVWSANRNELVRQGSKVDLTTDGQLVLNDQTGKQISTSFSATTGVSYAAMLDTGNFVLASQDSSILWQSFDNPTDTILPTQIMNRNSQLIARYTETNYSSGRFKFMLQTDGNLLLYTTSFPFDDAVAAYWSTQDSIPIGYQVIFNQTGYLYLIARNGTILNTVFSTVLSTEDFYLRATIDYDGVFRQYAYPKSAATSNGSWPMSWTTLKFEPSNICMRIGGDHGSGACGYNSYCMLGEDQRPICQCILGYSFIDPQDIRKGCIPKSNFIFCDEESQETDPFELVTMPNADWGSSYEDFKAVTEDWCRQACLNDCFCAVATFKDGECQKQKTPLANGRVDPQVGGKALLKPNPDKDHGLFLSIVKAQTYRNLTLGSSLTARNDNSSWASPSGDFAFGFQQIGTQMFLLAIWFNKIPEKTIIWSANGENLVQEGSKIELTMDGQFVLSDPKGKEVWRATLSGTGAAYAAMLDTGNLILASQDSTTLWQSFDQPTDTILPGQQMNQGNKLVARYSEMNYSSGRFEFTLQADGNLVLYTRALPLDMVNTPYWASRTVGSGFQVIFNQSGYIYLIARNGSILNLIASNGASSSDFYQRATLEYDGVFRQYVYPKTNGASTGRSTSWSLLSWIPSDICMRITGQTGGGACGFNSYCILGTDQRPRCECPPGYSFLDPNNQMNGCKQDFVSQDCDGVQEANRFSFREMPNTDWPLSDYEYFQPVTEDWCRQVCLNDCFCAVAIFRNGNCWKKKIPLSNGRFNPSVGGKALIKIRQENSTCKSIGGGSSNEHSTLILVGSVLLSSSVFMNFLLLIGTLFIISRFNKRRKKMLQLFPAMQGMSLRCFTFKELEEASSKFKEELGRVKPILSSFDVRVDPARDPSSDLKCAFEMI